MHYFSTKITSENNYFNTGLTGKGWGVYSFNGYTFPGREMTGNIFKKYKHVFLVDATLLTNFHQICA